MGQMNVMGVDGDTKHVWDVDDPASVTAASGVYDLYVGKGYKAFSMSADGTQGEQLDAFDAAAGSILFVPPMVGG